MHQAVLYGNQDVRVEPLDPVTVGPGDVRVDVDTCGICGTDLHEYAHGPVFAPVDDPHPLTGKTLPVPLGHEFGGTVTDVGSEVDRLALGDHVAIHPILPCGRCRPCEAGKYHLCERIGFVGVSGVGGGFADSTVVPAANAIRVPEDVTAAEAALIEPLNATIHGIRRSTFAPGDDVAILGAGPIGLLLLQAVRESGADRVFVSEPTTTRRELAGETGATETLDPAATDVVATLDERTGDGVDVAFEVSGTEAGLSDAIRSTRPDGCVTIVSIFDEEVAINPTDIVAPERTVVGTLGSLAGPRAPRGEFRTAARWLSEGRIDVGPLVTATIGVEEIVSEGFEALLAEGSTHVKILVEP
jgi:(R,R)-butanediol dehydrogenase/meso-butanediol dehydrogenase/diacetyl reductase